MVSYQNPNEQAPFNMAVETLMSLSEILKDIKNLVLKPEISREMAQELKIKLTRSFFVRASTLFDRKEDIKEMKDKLFKIEAKFIPSYRKVGGLPPKMNGSIIIYDPKIDDALDELLIDIQVKLQTKGYFMPAAEDKSRAIILN